MGFPRCSPSVWRSASSAILFVLLAACGTTQGAAAPTGGARVIAFTDVASTQMSRHSGGAAIAVGADAAAAVPSAGSTSGRVLVAALQGEQRTGGYGIHIDRIERDGDRLVVRATFTEPPPGGVVTQVLTSPAHVVSIAASDATGVKTAVLLDRAGGEHARATIP